MAASFFDLALPLLLFFLFAVSTSSQLIRRLQRGAPGKLQKEIGRLFIWRFLPSKKDLDGLLFITSLTERTLQFLFLLVSFALLKESSPLYFAALLLLLLFVSEFLPRIIAPRFPLESLIIFSPIATASLLFFLPFTLPTLWLYRKSSQLISSHSLKEPEMKVKQELIEMVQEIDTGESLDRTEKDLIESVIGFRSRIAREVMTPRVEVFALPLKTPIREAARLLIEEGYSRVPIYRQNVDEITGILLYKDVLIQYMHEMQNPGRDLLSQPIEAIAKKPLFTPETKKISHLLQDFRIKQMHIAIVVDEYGGTEGILTIEDILEEIVGDIADEYDEDTALYTELPSGSWIVDARMTINDIEEVMKVTIPQEGDYDTLGGFIYHRTGSIPRRGFVIDLDAFKLDILKSTDRGVEKVRLTVKSS